MSKPSSKRRHPRIPRYGSSAIFASSARSARGAWASSMRPSRCRWGVPWHQGVAQEHALGRPGQAAVRREAKSAAKLHHTNIVPVFGVGEQDGLPYYVMQYIQGLGLDAVLDGLNHIKPEGSTAGTAGEVVSVARAPPRPRWPARS